MVPRNLLKCRLQQRAIQAAGDLKEEGLIVVMGILKILLEKPVLNRSERYVTGQGSLCGLRLIRNTDHCGEFRDGLILEEQCGGKFQPFSSGECNEVNAEDRVTSEFEEVVMGADFFNP